MICSSEKRFFTSNLLLVGDWIPNRRATQNRGDVAAHGHAIGGALGSESGDEGALPATAGAREVGQGRTGGLHAQTADDRQCAASR